MSLVVGEYDTRSKKLERILLILEIGPGCDRLWPWGPKDIDACFIAIFWPGVATSQPPLEIRSIDSRAMSRSSYSPTRITRVTSAWVLVDFDQ